MSAVIAFDEFFLVLGGGEDLGKADAGVHIVLEEGHNSVGILVFAFKGAAEGSG